MLVGWGGVGGAIRVQSQGHNKDVGGVGWVKGAVEMRGRNNKIVVEQILKSTNSTLKAGILICMSSLYSPSQTWKDPECGSVAESLPRVRL